MADKLVINGHLILMMAPMASGKGQLVAHVREQYPEIKFLVSCTTRAPRPGEVEGADYYFVTREEFETRVANGEFLEWAEFSGNLYGTLKSEITGPLEAGQVVLNEIEIQGIQILEKLIPKEHRTLIYIEAGGWEVSLRRMKARAPMDEDHVMLRYQRYLEEIKAKDHADVIVENFDGELDRAKQQLDEVIKKILHKVA